MWVYQREKTIDKLLTVHRRTKDGGIEISPLAPMAANILISKFPERDFGINEAFVQKVGQFCSSVNMARMSIWLGEQFPIKLQLGFALWNETMLDKAGEWHTLHWRTTALHGYIGSTSELKWATKVYFETESDDYWSMGRRLVFLLNFPSRNLHCELNNGAMAI